MSQHKHLATTSLTRDASVHSQQLGALRPLTSPLQLQHMPLLRLQDMADKSLDLLQAISDALSDWSGAVSRAAQQQPGSGRQPAMSQDEAAELHETSFWLLLAAASLLLCMWSEALCSRVHERQLLGTLGQLLRRVRPSPDGICSVLCPLHGNCQVTSFMIAHHSCGAPCQLSACWHDMYVGGLLQTHVRARHSGLLCHQSLAAGRRLCGVGAACRCGRAVASGVSHDGCRLHGAAAPHLHACHQGKGWAPACWAAKLRVAACA